MANEFYKIILQVKIEPNLKKNVQITKNLEHQMGNYVR